MPSSIDVGLEVSKGLEHSLLKIFRKEVGDEVTMLSYSFFEECREPGLSVRSFHHSTT